MSTKISKNGWRQRVLGKAAAIMQQQGSRADHQAEGEHRQRRKMAMGGEVLEAWQGWRREQNLMRRMAKGEKL